MDTGKMPAGLVDVPDVPQTQIYLVNAFYTLNYSRQVGMGMGFIPYSEISRYFKDNPPILDEIDEAILYIQEMDSEFVTIHSKKP